MSLRVKIVSKVNSFLDKNLGFKITNTRQPYTPQGQGTIGVVDHFGRKNITGWVSTLKSGSPVKVSLYLNDYPIHHTWANVKINLNSPGEAYSFYIGTRGIWDFCEKKDRLTVRVDNNPLPIAEKGVYKTPRGDATRTLSDLKSLFEKGYMFNRRGDLQLSKKLDTEWQNQVINLSQTVTDLLKEKLNITPFLIYGSLLGQVREKNFIGHDDDLDIAYISKYKTGKRAAEELVEIASLLRNSGFDVELKATALHIHDKNDSSLRIDLFHLYFNKDDNLCFPFGVAGKKHYKKSYWNGVIEGSISGNVVYIPSNPERMVECLYGASWKVPVAGFNWNHARTRRDREGIVPHETRELFNKS